MQPPDISNLTVPGGVIISFDDGTGMRDLGYLTGMDCSPKTDEYKHESNRSGSMKVVKTFVTSEELLYKFKLHEPVVANMALYFKGGAIETVGGGTAGIVDQKATLTGILLASLGKYALTAVTVRQFLDKCFFYDGAEFTDYSVAADSLDGTPFATLADAGDVLYLGKATKFKEVYFDFATPGSYGAVVVEYWNGSAWAAVADLGGAAAALAADGKMNWTLPTDWAMNAVNGYTGYFIKITATTPWTTPATINEIRQNAVVNVDYILDPGQASGTTLQTGRVGRLATGFLADGEEVMVSFTHATWTSIRFPLATTNFKEGAARIDFLTKDGNGLQWRKTFTKCQIKPDGDIKMGGEDKKTMEIPLQLEVLDDSVNYPAAPMGYWEALSED